MLNIKIVSNDIEATSTVNEFMQDGYRQDDIYLFSYDKKETEQLTETNSTGELGIKEQGLSKTISHIFKARGGEVLSKLQTLGVHEEDAKNYERELKEGKYLVVATADIMNKSK